MPLDKYSFSFFTSYVDLILLVCLRTPTGLTCRKDDSKMLQLFLETFFKCGAQLASERSIGRSTAVDS